MRLGLRKVPNNTRKLQNKRIIFARKIQRAKACTTVGLNRAGQKFLLRNNLDPRPVELPQNFRFRVFDPPCFSVTGKKRDSRPLAFGKERISRGYHDVLNPVLLGRHTHTGRVEMPQANTSIGTSLG